MFSGARNVFIQGSNSFVVEQHGRGGLDYLRDNVNHSAAHDSAERYPPPKCHPKTRRAIVQGIAEWFYDLSRPSQILWLEGPAGCGKTAISQTFCEMLSKGELAGNFFFSRSAVGRSSSKQLFATLAYQLAISVPVLRPHIENAIQGDYSIIHSSPGKQLQTLIVQPLKQITNLNRPLVIVIDGLDECIGESNQRDIIRLIGGLYDNDPSFPICFMVGSRPEFWIRAELGGIHRNLRQVSLEHTAQTDNDIRVYYESGFESICKDPEHRYIMANVPLPWPSPLDLSRLVEKASGQFIYAATVLKFVGDHNYRPLDQLKLVLAIPIVSALTSNPFADLDRLYLQILATVANKERTLEFLGALSAIIFLCHFDIGASRHSSTMVEIAERLLGYPHGKGRLALRAIHSLLYVPDPVELCSPTTEPTYAFQITHVRFHHRSFQEFLLDADRSGDYFIDLDSFHARIAIACFQIERLYIFDGGDVGGDLDDVWAYSVLQGFLHLTPTLSQISVDEAAVHLQNSCSYIFWFCSVGEPAIPLGPKKVRPLLPDVITDYILPLEVSWLGRLSPIWWFQKEQLEKPLQHVSTIYSKAPAFTDYEHLQMAIGLVLLVWLNSSVITSLRLLVRYRMLHEIADGLSKENKDMPQFTFWYFHRRVLHHAMAIVWERICRKWTQQSVPRKASCILLPFLVVSLSVVIARRTAVDNEY